MRALHVGRRRVLRRSCIRGQGWLEAGYFLTDGGHADATERHVPEAVVRQHGTMN